MKTMLRLSVFILLSVLPLKLFAASETTLDMWMTPAELAQELGLPAAEEPLTLQRNPLTPSQVYQRYGVNVFAEFPVVILINKAARGPTAQRLLVYHQGDLVGNFATSTGRERWETSPSGKHYFTTTPVGWFRPIRFIKDYFSQTWEAPMRLSVFFNGGIAVHATTPSHYKDLGQRASGGCVRLTMRNAQVVWNLTYGRPSRVVPVFNRDGTLKTDSSGRVVRRRGSGTLIIVLNQ
jgi:hypothetical protein